MKIKEILMKRDGDSEEVANQRIRFAREDLEELLEEGDVNIDGADDILREHFGLEPDYLIELLGF